MTFKKVSMTGRGQEMAGDFRQWSQLTPAATALRLGLVLVTWLTLLDLAFANEIPRPSRPIPIGTSQEHEALPKNIGSELSKFLRSDYDDLYDGLYDICPCFVVRIRKVSRGEGGPRAKREGGEIIIRHPGDVADLGEDGLDFSDRDITRPKRSLRRHLEDIEGKAEDFCDCYERYRAGCNLVWTVATAANPPTLWKRGLGETSAATGHAGGHVGWNSADGESGKSRVPDRDGHTDEDSRTTHNRPSSLGLAHELAHAYNSIKGEQGSMRKGADDWEEFKATRMENQIRAEMLADAMRARDDRSNQTLRDNDFRELGPRSHYSDNRPLPEPPGLAEGTIEMTDLFDCDDAYQAVSEGVESDTLEVESNR